MAEEKKKVPPVADRLVYYVRAAGWPLFVDQHAVAHTFAGGQAIPISRANRPLTRLLYEHEEKAPSNDGLIGARRVLDMLAHDSGDVRELHTRAAYHEGAVFYELAPGRVVRIDEHGWKVDPDPPIYFRAVKNLKGLPEPTRGGKLEDVAEWVNLKTDRDRRLFLTYVTLAALAHVQRPILQTTGVMGSGKSTACRVVKRLLDPTGNEAVTIDRRDFLQKAAHCYILMLDNQNSLPEWFQDTLCRLVTGESDSKRVLYTDEEDLVWSMHRAVLLNGINPPSDRGDVQDRALPIELERLDKHKRLPEDDFWLQFSLKHPQLLGAVFDALSGALRERHTVQLAERPRLADWGLYAAALYESQGWGVGAFVDDWKGVEETQQQGTMDGSIVAQAVILYMKNRDRVELSAAKLHAAIEKRAADDLDLTSDKTWPKTGRTLWKKVREVTPLLEVHGIRAYRKNDNRSGRPIILDTDFEGGPDDDNYAKHTDDNADDNRVADDNADDKFGVSSAATPHTYAETDDNGSDGRYFGDSLTLHTLIKKEGGGEGESNPNLSSASSVIQSEDVRGLLARPPAWLADHMAHVRREGTTPTRLEALAAAVAAHLTKNPTRGREALPAVEAFLAHGVGCDCEECV
jgi:energy-coupling factor transporter ATP-binding protein EcfA2